MNQPIVPSQQAGMVLVICLIMLLVLTLVATVAMRSTTMDLKMTTNTMLNARAFQASESSRRIAANVISDHIFHRGWPSNVSASTGFTSLPTGLSVVDNNAELWVSNNADLADMSSGAEDLTYQIDGNGDGDFDDQQDIKANIYITKLATIAAPGSDTSQVTGYEGLGGGAASGGAYIFFDIRTGGSAPGNARATTGVEYRHVVSN